MPKEQKYKINDNKLNKDIKQTNKIVNRSIYFKLNIIKCSEI